MLRPIWGLFGGRKQKSKLDKLARSLDVVDQCIEDQKNKDAIKHLKKTIMYNVVKKPDHVHFWREHHHNVLSRCLILSEETNTSLEYIAELEKLINERAELQSLYFKASESYNNLRFRRKQAGKDMPDWSKSDFETRIVQIKEELIKNKTELEQSFNVLFTSLLNPVDEEDPPVTIH